MRWLECSTRAEPEAVDAVAELFGRWGQGVAIEEPVVSSPDGEAVWIERDRPVLVKTYLPLDERTEERRARLEEASGTWAGCGRWPHWRSVPWLRRTGPTPGRSTSSFSGSASGSSSCPPGESTSLGPATCRCCLIRGWRSGPGCTPPPASACDGWKSWLDRG